MSEGELKKRMIAQWSNITDRKSIDWVLEPFYAIIDEAKKDLYDKLVKMEAQAQNNLPHGTMINTSQSRVGVYARWVELWFGDKK